MLYQINLSYACAGIVIESGYVTLAAPIFDWMVGKTYTEVADWVEKKERNYNQMFDDVIQLFLCVVLSMTTILLAILIFGLLICFVRGIVTKGWKFFD